MTTTTGERRPLRVPSPPRGRRAETVELARRSCREGGPLPERSSDKLGPASDPAQEQHIRRRRAQYGYELVAVESGPNAPYMVVDGC